MHLGWKSLFFNLVSVHRRMDLLFTVLTRTLSLAKSLSPLVLIVDRVMRLRVF